MWMPSMLFAATVLSVPAAVAEYEAGEIVSARTSSSIAIDGSLDEAAWAEAPRVGPMRRLEDRRPAPGCPTYVRARHDATTLYIAVESSTDTPLDTPEARPGRTGRPRGDRIEVFLDPRPDTDDYYHFTINRAGQLLDAYRPNEGDKPRLHGVAWEADWSCATTQTDDGWRLEIGFPFAIFETSPPSPGALWRLKVARNGCAEGLLMWPDNPTSSFHSRCADAMLHFGAPTSSTRSGPISRWTRSNGPGPCIRPAPDARA